MFKARPALFKWRHFEPGVITCAVSWYLRFSLSYRNVEELLAERGLAVDHTTVWRGVQLLCAGPEPALSSAAKAYQGFLAGR